MAEDTFDIKALDRIGFYLRKANITFSSVSWDGEKFTIAKADPLQLHEAMLIIEDVVSGIMAPMKFNGKEVMSASDVDHITIQRIQDRIRPDGDETLKLNAELREMKMAIYASLKLINAILVSQLTTQQRAAVQPLLDQINVSIALTDEVIAIRNEGEAFKKANGL